MKLVKILLCLFVFISLTTAQTKSKNQKSGKNLITQEDSVSYAIGSNIGSNLQDPSMKINFEMLIEGIRGKIKGNSKLTDTLVAKVLKAFNDRLIKKKTDDQSAITEKNKKIGQEFLKDNKKKQGVITLPNGLQYKVITEGTGDSPRDSSIVKVNYKGTLIDGREFDSSYKRGEPAQFPLNQVIKGWTIGVQLMKVGSKYQFFIPSDLGYGDNSAGEMIEPGSTLIFEVELLEIVKK
jgi:FKBP-type peptidyl-prolyl cis-trans isomerase